MFNHSHGKLSLAQPSFYIPQPNHSLYDVLVKSYGIQPGQEPLFSVLLDYLQALNPEIKNPRLALGNKAPRTLDFISYDPNTLLCMNPEVVKARIRQAIAMGGGILLTGFGVAGACAKIAYAEDSQKKNEIFMTESTGLIIGTAGGIAAGMLVGAIIATGPIGWGVALVASMSGGYLAQEGGKLLGKFFYDQFGNQVNLASATGVSSLCR